MLGRLRHLNVIATALVIGVLLLGVAVALPSLASAHTKIGRASRNRSTQQIGQSAAAAPTTTIQATRPATAPVVPAPAPVLTTTAPPAPPPAPVTHGPSSSSLPVYTGPTTITSPTTISNVRITQPIEIRSAVVMRNVDIAATGYSVVRVYGSLDISDFRINGTGGPQNEGGLNGDNITARNGEIFGVENGIVGGSNHLIEDVYIHDLAMVGSGHPDGVQYDGGNTNITLRRLRIAVNDTDTSAVMIDNFNGSSAGIVIQDCNLSGGGYTLYLEGQFNSSTVGVTSITGTTFSGFGYGPVLRRGPITVGQQTSNTSNSSALTF